MNNLPHTEERPKGASRRTYRRLCKARQRGHILKVEPADVIGEVATGLVAGIAGGVDLGLSARDPVLELRHLFEVAAVEVAANAAEIAPDALLLVCELLQAAFGGRGGTLAFGGGLRQFAEPADGLALL